MSRLQIHHLDVGQGDSTLILYFDDNDDPNYSVLLDCGENHAYRRVIEILNEYGFETLNTILITHYDSDHFIGVIHLLRLAAHRNSIDKRNMLSGTQIWDPGIPEELKEKNFFTKYLKRIKEVQEIQITEGITPIRRITQNLMGRSGAEETGIKQFNLLEFDGMKAQSFTHIQGAKPSWYIPFRPMYLRSSGRLTSYKVLIKNAYWPIGLDVVNRGRQIAQLTDTSTKLKDITQLPFNIDVLIGNGVGKQNEGTDDRLIKEYKNDNSVWGQRVNSEVGARVTEIAQSKDDNEVGMGYLLRFEKFRYWFGGDLKTEQEDALTDAIGNLSVLKAGHHGSHHSSSVRFLAETTPMVVIISTASDWNETVKLPHVETLGRFNDCPSIQGVFMTGMPIPKDLRPKYVPGPKRVYDVNRKFQVAGTDAKASSEIVLYIDSSEAVKDEHLFEVRYREQNVKPSKKRKRNPEGEEVRHSIKKRRLI